MSYLTLLNVTAMVQTAPLDTGATDSACYGHNTGVIADILAATRASASWKAFVQEGTHWTGTAEESIQNPQTLVVLHFCLGETRKIDSFH